MCPRTVAQRETRTTATCLGWRRSTAGLKELTSGKTAAVLQMSFREKISAGQRAINISAPAETNTPSPSGANHLIWKWTNWRRKRSNSERSVACQIQHHKDVQL